MELDIGAREVLAIALDAWQVALHQPNVLHNAVARQKFVEATRGSVSSDGTQLPLVLAVALAPLRVACARMSAADREWLMTNFLREVDAVAAVIDLQVRGRGAIPVTVGASAGSTPPEYDTSPDAHPSEQERQFLLQDGTEGAFMLEASEGADNLSVFGQGALVAASDDAQDNHSVFAPAVAAADPDPTDNFSVFEQPVTGRAAEVVVLGEHDVPRVGVQDIEPMNWDD
jgi:hypothetical protein